jgi:hypothetical protein
VTSERAIPTAERIEEIRRALNNGFVNERAADELLCALDAAQARIAAVESDRQRDAYEAGERLYAAERRAEVAEARIAELEQRTESALSAADESATGMARNWVRLQRAEATIARVEALCNVTLSGGEQWPIHDSKTVKVGDIRAALAGGAVPVSAEEPERHVVDYEGEFAGCDGCEFCAPVAAADKDTER